MPRDDFVLCEEYFVSFDKLASNDASLTNDFRTLVWKDFALSSELAALLLVFAVPQIWLISESPG